MSHFGNYVYAVIGKIRYDKYRYKNPQTLVIDRSSHQL